MEKKTVGFAMCGSFCTFRRVIGVMKTMSERYELIPILSHTAYETDTRFGTAEHFRNEIEAICRRPILHTITQVEPIGPKGLLDLLVIAPCTGNTISKLALGISDTPVTLAAKAHARNRSPTVIAVSSNDALSATANNLGTILRAERYFFVPFGQDAPNEKEASAVAHFEKLPETVAAALEGRQIQPILSEYPNTL